jgi:tetratricopeptide (TPR) repeat protein
MARADRRRVQRPKDAARPARGSVEHVAAPAPVKRKPRKKEETWEDTLFFNRIRRHAKWVFVLLALAFGGTFVIFGVGSGGSGLGDLLLQNNGNNGGTDIPSVSKAREEVAKNPRSAAAQYDLAQAAEQEGDTDTAIAALETYGQLRPSDREKLEELAGLYLSKAQLNESQARAASAANQLATADPTFQIALQAPPKPKETQPQTVPLGSSGGVSIESALSSQASTVFNEKYQAMTTAYGQAEQTYQRIANLAPKDPTAQIQLAQAAQQAGDLQTALKAYQRFLKLAPDDPSADIVRAQITQLRAQTQAAG